MIHVSPTGHTSSSSSVGSSGWRTGCRRQGGPPGASPLPPHGGPGGTPRPAATGSPRTGPGPAGGGSASAAEASSWSHLREGETHTGLATGFDIGTTPVFRYIRESLQVLAALAPARRLDCGRRRVTGVRPQPGARPGPAKPSAKTSRSSSPRTSDVPGQGILRAPHAPAPSAPAPSRTPLLRRLRGRWPAPSGRRRPTGGRNPGGHGRVRCQFPTGPPRRDPARPTEQSGEPGHRRYCTPGCRRRGMLRARAGRDGVRPLGRRAASRSAAGEADSRARTPQHRRNTSSRTRSSPRTVSRSASRRAEPGRGQRRSDPRGGRRPGRPSSIPPSARIRRALTSL